MEEQLPRWAARLKSRHPEAAMPTREDPIPDWLADETTRVPLWYTIREASETRNKHPFLLHKEIHRQPDQWAEIDSELWPAVGQLVDRLMDRGIRRIITTGCGSAFFTAIHGQFSIPRLCGIETTAIESFELANYFPAVDPDTTLVIGHSGTGGSIETVQAMEAASRRGCSTLAITNTDETPFARTSDLTLTYVTSQECGPCTSVVSTRILLQSMLATVIGEKGGFTGVESDQIRKALGQVAEVGRDFLVREENGVRDLAKTYKNAASWLLVGSGPNYFSAREGTLKIEEQAILVAKAYRTGDFHHDALSLVSPERVVVAIEAEGSANERVVDVLRAAVQAQSPTLAVTWTDGAGADRLAEAARHRIRLTPDVPEIVVPIPMTLVFQLLGYYLGVERGFNPDTLRTDNEPNTRAWLTSFPLGTH
jgi:glutamine---fructose-6-phosphate transaminase (isomerizing)